LDAVIKIQNHKYIGSLKQLFYVKPVFSNCGPLKKEIAYIKDSLYDEGPRECPETKHCHRKCLKLTFCVLCIILVLRGVLYTEWFHPGNRLIHPSDRLKLWGDTISRDTGKESLHKSSE